MSAIAGAYGAVAAIRKRLCRAAAVLGVLALTVAVPVAAQTLTLTALGDSLTQGFGLPSEEGFVPVLQDWLRAQGHDVNVINAGVSGDTTAGGLARIGWTLADTPDAMIVALGGNDLLRGIDPAASRANLDGILTAAGEAGVPVLLAGLEGHGNFGPEFKRDFEAMFVELAAEHGALLVRDFLAPLTARVEAGESLSGLMQGDNIHPSAEGVRLIVEAIGPEVARLLERVQDGAGG